MVVGGRFGSGEIGYGSESDLAYYDAAFGIMLLALALHEAFVTTPLTFFNHREKKTGERKFAGKMLFLSICFSTLTLAVMSVGTWYQYKFTGIAEGFLWAIIGLTMLLPVQIIKEFSRRWMFANLQVRQATVLELGFAACFLLLTVMLIYFAWVSAATVLGVTLIANLICLSAWWRYFGHSFALTKTGVVEQAADNFRYGKWIAGENVCSVAMMYFSQWFLISRIGEVGAGVYSACLTIVFLANPFLLGVSSVFAPQVAKVFNKQGWKGMFPILLSYSGFVVLVLAVFSAGLFFLGQSLTTLAFGDNYDRYFINHNGGSNTITFILSLSLPCFGLSFLLTCCILAADKPFYCFYAAAVGMTVSVVINFSFAVPDLSTAAISFVTGAFASMAFRAVFVGKMYFDHLRAAPSEADADLAAR